MPKLRNGTVVNSYFNVVDAPTGKTVYEEGLRFLHGQVEKVHYLDDSSNISKKVVEYDVSVRDAKGGQSVYRNVRQISSFFGTTDYQQTILEPNEFAFSGKLDPSNFFENKNGCMVVLAFLHGSKDKPVILGALPHPKKGGIVGAKKKDGIHTKGEFRGFQWEINKDGDFVLIFNGAKKPNGSPANPALSKTTIKIGKDGKVTTTSGHRITIENDKGKEKVQVYTAGKQLFEINDLAGQEAITLVHKTGAMFNIDKIGSIKLSASDGAYLYLNAELGEISLVQADGNIFTVGKENTLGSKDGGKAFSVIDTALQAFSDKDIILQAAQKLIVDGGGVILQEPVSNFSLQNGVIKATTVSGLTSLTMSDTAGTVIDDTASLMGITLQDSVAKIKLKTGQIALGTPAAELLDLFNQLLIQLTTLLGIMSASSFGISTAPGSPTAPNPALAASLAPITAQIAAIQTLLLTIKGTI